MTKNKLAWKIIELSRNGQEGAVIGDIFYSKHLVDRYTKKQLETIVDELENSYKAEFMGNFIYDCCIRKYLQSQNKYYYFPIYKDGIIGTGNTI